MVLTLLFFFFIFFLSICIAFAMKSLTVSLCGQGENAESGHRKIQFGCVDSDVETPDPIPNSAVKHVSGDGTALLSVGE